jgi:hypothetical protein
VLAKVASFSDMGHNLRDHSLASERHDQRSSSRSTH